MIACLVVLAACVQAPVTPDKQYESFRSDLKAQREQGEIGAVEEQVLLRERFWQLFGRDPESVGHFAFSISIMRSAVGGAIPMQEAEALVQAREDALIATRMEWRRISAGYHYAGDD